MSEEIKFFPAKTKCKNAIQTSENNPNKVSIFVGALPILRSQIPDAKTIRSTKITQIVVAK